MIAALALGWILAVKFLAYADDEPLPVLKYEAAPRKLVIAFSSLRDRPAFANLYFYEHDGVGKGKIGTTVPPEFERSDAHPSLTNRSALCVYASKQVGGFTPLVNLWNRRENRVLPSLALNSLTGSRIEPAVSGDGKWLVVSSRGHADSAGGWDLLYFSLPDGELNPVAGLNTEFDEREATLDGAGRFVAYVSNHKEGAGLSDLRLYDRMTSRLVDLGGVNTPYRELNPALSANGRFLAFVSDRSGGAGGKDIYLYDLEEGRLVDLPGVNSPAHEQTPTLSADGRYLAFVSERTRGAGERDIYLYDRVLARLLDTPGLNSVHEDFDPSLAFDQLDEAEPIK